jgi:nitronate monooxygenase
MMKPEEIRTWSDEFRKSSQGEFQINLWIPETPPARDFELEKQQRKFLAKSGPPVPPEAGDTVLPDFEAQCQTMLTLAPRVISSIMGERLTNHILWCAA